MNTATQPEKPTAEYRRAIWAREQGLVAYPLDELLRVRFPARRALLCRGDVAVFREGHLGEVYAPRGVGKTWLLQTLGLVASAGVEALGFRAPEPRRVLYIDGEMSSEEVQARFTRLCKLLSATPNDNLSVIGADWQPDYMPRLDTPEGQVALEPFVDRADLIILDNRSCLFDPEGEKDPVAWQPAQEWLLSLRRRGKGVLAAHHSNRMGGARGHSKPEDTMNLLLKLSRPDGYVQDQGARFLVEFDKARGIHGPAAAPFIAALTESGWAVEGAKSAEGDGIRRKLISYIQATAKVGEAVKSANAAIRGARVNRNVGLNLMAEMIEQGDVVRTPDGLKLR